MSVENNQKKASVLNDAVRNIGHPHLLQALITAQLRNFCILAKCFLGGSGPAMWETGVRSPGWEDPLEKGMATHSSTLAWSILWTEEPGKL